jgi:hypothetical protein
MNLRYIKTAVICAVFMFGLLSCGVNRKDADKSIAPADVQLINPALPGDNPDPSIIRIGKVYYAIPSTNR